MSVLSSFFSPSSVPASTAAAAALQPGQQAEGQALITKGAEVSSQAAPYLTAGTTALQMAETGQLTPEQQASLTQQKDLLTNQAMQMYASEGRTPTKDTSFIGTEASISATVMAAAQSFIQTTLQIAGQAFSAGVGLLSAGAQITQEGLSFETQGASELLADGQQQVSLDQQFASEVGSAFQAVGVAGGLAMGNPAALSGVLKNIFSPSTTPNK